MQKVLDTIHLQKFPRINLSQGSTRSINPTPLEHGFQISSTNKGTSVPTTEYRTKQTKISEKGTNREKRGAK